MKSSSEQVEQQEFTYEDEYWLSRIIDAYLLGTGSISVWDSIWLPPPFYLAWERTPAEQMALVGENSPEDARKWQEETKRCCTEWLARLYAYWYALLR